MSAGIWAAAGTGLTIVLLVLRYILSGDAKRDAAEEQFKKDESARRAAQEAAAAAAQAAQPQASAGAGSAWDAADQEGNHP